MSFDPVHPAASLAAQRPVQAEDLLRLQTFGESALSPTGDALAVVVQDAAANIVPDQTASANHGEIWLVTPSTAGAMRISPSFSGDSYWSPSWSSDGRYLAAIVTSPRQGVRLAAWERASATWRDLTPDSVDLGVNFRLSGGFPPIMYQWVDSNRLLLAMESPRDTERSGVIEGCPEAGREEWGCPGVHVLRTDGGTTSPAPRRRLVLLDVATGGRSTLAEADVRYVQAPPGGPYASIIAAPEEASSAPELRLAVVPLAGGGAVRWIDGIIGLSGLPANSLRWSPDLSYLAVIGREQGEEGQALFVVDGSGEILQRSPAKMHVRNLAWRGADPVVLARPSAAPNVPHQWLRWTDDATFEPLFGGDGPAPGYLVPTPAGLVGIAEGRLVLLDKDDLVADLTTSFPSSVQRIVWPDIHAQPHGMTDVVVATTDGELHHIGFAMSHPSAARRLDSPRSARFAAYDTTSGSWLAVSEMQASAELLIGTGAAPGQAALTLNGGFAEVSLPRRQLLRYQGPSGDSLSALLLVPAEYDEARPLPLIISVYGGQLVRDETPPGFGIGDWPANSLLPYAAAGYGVLVPSMPMPPAPDSEPCAAVLPLITAAADAAIAAGVADEDRLALHGHSFGGYNVLCALRETDRFRTAVVMAGYADLVALHSAFPPMSRWGIAPHLDTYLETVAERGQIRMGVPPWDDSSRYLRNSPIHDVDAIRTPLMIVHGELDYVPVQQAENLFKALARLERGALLVRYRDEGHVIRSPANVVDLHERIGAWLEHHLR